MVVNKRNKDIEDFVYKDIKKKELLKVISSLSPLEQQLIHLRYTEELSYKEIASQAGLNTNTVGIKLHRIVKKLKLLIKEVELNG